MSLSMIKKIFSSTLLPQTGAGVAAGKVKYPGVRDAVDGGADLDQAVTDAAGKANIVPTDRNGLAFGRSASQVLNIVYLGGASGGFGFFPGRLNGTIR